MPENHGTPTAPRAPERAERLRSALYRISETTVGAERLEELYPALHAIVGELMYARNFYVAVRDSDGLLRFPYFADEADPAPEPRRLGRGLTEYVLRTGEPLLASPAVAADLLDRGEIERLGRPAVDWLGVPLKRGREAFGVLVVQSYRAEVRYHDADRDLLNFVGQHVASALERRRAAEALRESEAKFRTLADAASVAIFIHQGPVFRYVNDALALLTGYPPAQLASMGFRDVLHPEDRPLVGEDGFALERAAGTLWRREVKAVRADGQERWVDLSAGWIEYEGKPAVLGTAVDVTDRKRAEGEILKLAYHDPLTGLANRALFLDRLSLAIAQAPRQKKVLAVLLLDLDRLKLINDSLGHGQGDKLLKAVGERLEACLRDGDTVARISGDEFAVLAPGLLRLEDAATIAQKLQAMLRQSFVIDGREVFVTASAGIALFPDDGADGETLLRNAHTAMYEAKEAGRDSFQPFTLGANSGALDRLALESDLRRALANGELHVHYQPQVALADGRTEGFEALLRWRHPSRGAVSPAVFVELAELTGMIVPIGAWVLRAACEDLLGLRAVHPELAVAVNLSARQFQQPDLLAEIARVLEETRLPPGALELEITETVAMQDSERTIATLRRLKDLGVKLSLDDFGTGHSSLSYLRRFPLDTLKIDQSFVRDVTRDAQTASIVQAIITMARSLGLRVVAEGVETAEQQALLRERGCDVAQGYLLSRPVPLEDLRRFLARAG
ncbi:MAG TPA: EAL domain-containing protein [Vicinamibacteria bacterium]|nr:EAL domain-containing protein [Vicinamibacteria bacterium]